jgi:hypothetical protein
MWSYLAEQEKIALMLLIIHKCLMIIEMRPKGRNPNITSSSRTPWKRWRIILVVICKSTFLEWVIWVLSFQNYGTIFCAIFWGGGLKINQEDILPILSKNYKRNGLLNKHDRHGEYYSHHTPMKEWPIEA